MPELPEVETIRRELNEVLPGKRLREVEVRVPKTIRGNVLLFKKNIEGTYFKAVQRRAKLLLFSLSNGQTFVVHLKMTGQLVFRHHELLKVGGHPIKDGAKDLPNKYSHVIFHLVDGGTLFFNDIRRFGFIQLIKVGGLSRYLEENKYGPEPLSDAFTLQLFQIMLRKKKTVRIKPLLLDQTFVAGIGNIYAIEACFAAGIRPTRRAGTLTKPEIKKLYTSIRRILIKAIDKHGTTADNYIDAYGQPGRYVFLLKMYGRAGEGCLRCGTNIKSLTLGGRGTAYCPKCQK
jgi:formamidopyrimidine-DNA glycosylase